MTSTYRLCIRVISPADAFGSATPAPSCIRAARRSSRLGGGAPCAPRPPAFLAPALAPDFAPAFFEPLISQTSALDHLTGLASDADLGSVVQDPKAHLGRLGRSGIDQFQIRQMDRRLAPLDTAGIAHA